jgi:hypothetical protein
VSSHHRPRRFGQAPRALALPATFVFLLGMLLILALTFWQASNAQAAGGLTVEIVTGYNLIVDSNVSSPSTYAPSVATVMGRFCNTGATALNGVTGYIGNYVDGTNDTPGIYPARTVDAAFTTLHPALDNAPGSTYAFTHVGGRLGTADASRNMGTLAPGECRAQYWHFTYPQCENTTAGARDLPPCNSGDDPAWGDSVKPGDDLWLDFDIWARNDTGSANDNRTWRMTMRNEISAMANKIEPNPDGEWFNVREGSVQPGDVITSNGIRYEFGLINQGFDNDGNYTPDYNAWAQPIGDASYDPSCFRLIRTTGVLTVTRSAGNPDLVVPFVDQLYFMNLPDDNTGVRGDVRYTFLALNGPCSTSLSPYQEVASGYDNEKFNGDYGTAIPPIESETPQVNIDKTGNLTVAKPGTITYQIPFQNLSSTTAAGMTLSSGYGVSMPLVISDTVPNGLNYVGGSANYSLTYTPNHGVMRLYSTNSGRTWSTTDPGTTLSTWPNSKVIIQWWLNDPLPPSSSGNYATYQAEVPSSYSLPFVENCADGSFGASVPFDRACATTLVQGDNSIGDYVWRDENNDGLQAGETSNGINAVKVSLYWDTNGDGMLDSGDKLITTADSSGSTTSYLFSSLPDGRYLVVVDKADADLPVGYRITTPGLYAVALDPGGTDPSPVSFMTADFGFGPSLGFDKQLISGDPAYEGEEVVFHVDITNNRPGDGNPPGPCQYTVWSTTYTNGGGTKAWTNPANIVSAPDTNYATAPYKNAEESIDVTTWNLGSTPAETIQKVEALVPMLPYSPLAGTFQVQVLRGANTYDHLYDATVLAAGTWIVDVTNDNPSGSAAGWAWSDFTGGSTSTSVRLIAKKAGNPGGYLDVDAVGYRITTNQTCGNPSDTMNPVPLTDTYDAGKLQFLSATPPATTVSGGTITWANVGPIYAGQTKEIIIRFRALQPPDSDADGEPDPTTHTNCAATSGAVFADGTPANSASDCVTHNINPAGTIGDWVWADNDNSGGPTMTAGDIGLPNVTMRLYDCGLNGTCEGGGGDDILMQTTNTDSTGWYLFRGVRDINRPYQVVADATTLPGGATSWTCTYDDLTPYNSLSGPITIDYDNGSTVNDDYLGADFSYRYNGQYLFGTIWHDRNNSATPPPPDSGEEWLAGVSVSVCQNSNCQSQCTNLTTDPNGYFFTTVNKTGNWYVCVNATSGPLGTGTWAQTWDTDGLATPNRATVNVPANSYTRADFSYRRTDTIQLGDAVYTDWDGDGTQDAGVEEGISGVTVRLYLDDGDGVYEAGVDLLWQTTSTNSTGWYNFNVTPGGDYLVVLDQSTIPTGYKQTQDPDESGVCTTCNGYSDVQNQAATDLLQDFGFQPVGAGSIGDFVWRDLDRDGIQDGGSETGIANITVNLYEDVNGNGVIDPADALLKTTSTDANGNYLFSGLYVGTALNPARYLVDVDTADPQLPTDGSGHPYVLSTNNDPHLVTLTPASPTYSNADFGFTPGGAIGDTVWQDNNGNGLQDAGEPGIQNVSVQLWRDTNNDGTGDTLVGTTTTNASGNYYFTGLPAGDYVVVIPSTNWDQVGDPLYGFTQTYDPDASNVPCQGTGQYGCDSQGMVVDTTSGYGLPPGQIDYSIDFGYRPLGTIGDTLWINPNGNSIREPGESGIPNVTVWLCTTSPCTSGNAVQTTSTDVNGYYTFGNLTDGTYYVAANTGDPEFPGSLTPNYNPDGNLNSEVSQIVMSGGVVTSIGGNSCTNCNMNADIGYIYVGNNSVSGDIFYDPNNDAIQDGGETNTYAGVTIYLYLGGLRIGTTTTDANGHYSFGNLPDGNYVVSYNPNTPTLDGLEPTVTTSPTTYRSVALDPGGIDLNPVNVIDQDFGLLSNMDFGDLPSNYLMTLLANDGARHIVPSTGAVYLGTAAPDTEWNGQPSSDATGDGVDETPGTGTGGIVRTTGVNWAPGATGGSIDAIVGGCAPACYLSGWIDWNNDGDFGDAGERILTGQRVTNGTTSLTFPIPAGTSFSNVTYYARFRLYDTNNELALTPTGLAPNGEVEDYGWYWAPTAVRIIRFEAAAQPSSILLTWETATEVDNLGFNLYRSESPNGPQTQLNDSLLPSQGPGSPIGFVYTFPDEMATPGVLYYYWLEDVDVYGTATRHGPVTAFIWTEELLKVYLPTVGK